MHHGQVTVPDLPDGWCWRMTNLENGEVQECTDLLPLIRRLTSLVGPVWLVEQRVSFSMQLVEQ